MEATKTLASMRTWLTSNGHSYPLGAGKEELRALVDRHSKGSKSGGIARRSRLKINPSSRSLDPSRKLGFSPRVSPRSRRARRRVPRRASGGQDKPVSSACWRGVAWGLQVVMGVIVLLLALYGLLLLLRFLLKPSLFCDSSATERVSDAIAISQQQRQQCTACRAGPHGRCVGGRVVCAEHYAASRSGVCLPSRGIRKLTAPIQRTVLALLRRHEGFQECNMKSRVEYERLAAATREQIPGSGRSVGGVVEPCVEALNSLAISPQLSGIPSVALRDAVQWQLVCDGYLSAGAPGIPIDRVGVREINDHEQQKRFVAAYEEFLDRVRRGLLEPDIFFANELFHASFGFKPWGCWFRFHWQHLAVVVLPILLLAILTVAYRRCLWRRAQSEKLVATILEILHSTRVEEELSQFQPHFTALDHLRAELWEDKDEVVWQMVVARINKDKRVATSFRQLPDCAKASDCWRWVSTAPYTPKARVRPVDAEESDNE